MASTGRHGTVRGLPLKEVLEQVVPELSVSCLRLALSTPKVTEQLLKLDEQGVSQRAMVSGASYMISLCLLSPLISPPVATVINARQACLCFEPGRGSRV